jgi:hypothetical protein
VTPPARSTRSSLHRHDHDCNRRRSKTIATNNHALRQKQRIGISNRFSRSETTPKLDGKLVRSNVVARSSKFTAISTSRSRGIPTLIARTGRPTSSASHVSSTEGNASYCTPAGTKRRRLSFEDHQDRDDPAAVARHPDLGSHPHRRRAWVHLHSVPKMETLKKSADAAKVSGEARGCNRW